MNNFTRKVIILILIVIAGGILSSCSTTRITKPPTETVIYESPNIPNFARQGVYHYVAPGETLWRIAKMYEVDMDEIRQVNSIRDVRDIDIGAKLYIPGAAPRKHVLTLYPSSKWKYIIIHHSATERGSAQEFNEAHLKRGWKGVGYHFIIDNGTLGKDDGQIETGPRWIKQEDGAHCKAGSMNEQGIGICLVGNFSRDRVSRGQMDSLVYLTNKLRKYYDIPKNRIIGHGKVTGANTECPGKKFPWKTFRSRLGS